MFQHRLKMQIITDKFSKKLFAKLFMDGVGVTFTELDFCKNGKNLLLQKLEWFASQELLLWTIWTLLWADLQIVFANNDAINQSVSRWFKRYLKWNLIGVTFANIDFCKNNENNFSSLNLLHHMNWFCTLLWADSDLQIVFVNTLPTHDTISQQMKHFKTFKGISSAYNWW